MTNVVVVYNYKTLKLYDFTYGKHGVIEILSNEKLPLDNIRVKMVDIRLLDMENGFLKESIDGE